MNFEPQRINKDWPKYFKDRLIIGNLNSTVGIATLWTPKENIAEKLDPETFAVCGQLYTKQGINFMLRNILANPRIQNLTICGTDRQESGEALKKFFENGVEEALAPNKELAAWKVRGDSKALIDKEIPLSYLHLIRQKVKLYDMRSLSPEETAAQIRKIHQTSQEQGDLPFTDPVTFPEAEKAEVQTFPSDHSVFKIRREKIGDAWLDGLKIINRFGRQVPGMYGQVKQVENLSIVIEKEDPDDPEIFDYFNFDKKQLELYYEGFFDQNTTKNEAYTYGERIFAWGGKGYAADQVMPVDQAKLMVKKLKRFEFDRGALAVLWQPHIDNFPPPGTKRKEGGQTQKWRVPCLVMILGQVVEGKFDMTAIFRNNDIYGAWPLNAFALRAFQKDIAGKIGQQMGTLTTISHIAEIYELNWEDAKRVVAKNDNLGRTCQMDPRGYYRVEVGGARSGNQDEIVVIFYSPDGSRELAEYRVDGKKHKAARDLTARILRDFLVSELGAAADLGRQLAKAETAVKLGLKFEQDQPLQKDDRGSGLGGKIDL